MSVDFFLLVMRFLIPIFLLVVLAPFSQGAQLELLQWREGALHPVGQAVLEGEPKLEGSLPHLKVTVVPEKVGPFSQWKVGLHHTGNEVERVVLRIRVKTGQTPGIFWDGYHLHEAPKEPIVPTTKRYRFPLIAFLAGGRAQIAGFAPGNLSSRFERSMLLEEGKGEMVWDAYLALHPGQKDEQVLLTGELAACADYTEVVEAYYLAYPSWFLPVEGADSRLYGVGGFLRSRAETRDLQMEEARRFRLDWEWYYAPFQRAGAIMPDRSIWDSSYGYNLEQNLGIYDQMDGPEGWRNYHQTRIEAGDRTTAIFYYYLQQYASVDLLKERFPDSFWIDKKGNRVSPTFGWIKPHLWVQFAWPGETSYGEKLREDLAKVWESFPIAGYALDCVIGDTPYYGEALPKERGKAFDNDGKIFAVEGIAIARNLDFTHSLPPRKDGQRPASISNEAMTYHGIFFTDAMMHEKPPFERADLLPLRRLLTGQKPVYWWAGSYRLDSTLNWENITRDEFVGAAGGALDYVILCSLRYGGVPAVFMATGYRKVRGWLPRLIELQRAGWRAATYTKVPEAYRPPLGDPYAAAATLWISRFGSGEESWIVASSPKRERKEVPLEIATQRFSGKQLLYLDVKATPTRNEVSPTGTTVKVVLADHEPVLLKAVAEVESREPLALTLSFKGDALTGVTLRLQYEGKGKVRVRFIGEEAWRTLDAAAPVAERVTAPLYRFEPDEQWVEELELGNEEESLAAIVVAAEDRDELEAQVMQLAHYWEYYQMRQKAPASALASVHTARNPALGAKIVASLDDPAARQAATVFLVGKGARAMAAQEKGKDLIGSQVKEGQRLVYVEPGAQSEEWLWGEFLERLDRRFPYIGVLEHSPMHKHHQLEGTVFE